MRGSSWMGWLLTMAMVVTVMAVPSDSEATTRPVKVGPGVTMEPCVDGDGTAIGHPDRGCIYLASLPAGSGFFGSRLGCSR